MLHWYAYNLKNTAFFFPILKSHSYKNISFMRNNGLNLFYSQPQGKEKICVCLKTFPFDQYNYLMFEIVLS